MEKLEIKYRAIGIDKPEWIYGYVAFDYKKLNAVIIHKQANNEMQHTAVEPETVGQYTGLKDSKGVEIYEGDIFDKGIVVFSNGCFNGCYTCGTTSKKGWDYSDEWEDGLAEYARKNKVIGNIYQNPELINI